MAAGSIYRDPPVQIVTLESFAAAKRAARACHHEADRLEHARELLIRAVAVLTPIGPDDAAARAIAAEIEGTNDRLARLLGERPAAPKTTP